jgi:methylated-DNA-protein-cysteine methyltransferase related protein
MLEKLRATVRRIPKGRVATYGDVARAAGYPGAARQVVWALHHADGPLAWHRVLGAGGCIRLPGEAGLEQRMRLQAEGVAFRGSRVDMARHAFVFGGKARAGTPRTPEVRVPRTPAQSRRGLDVR